jgi:hypothetical protein
MSQWAGYLQEALGYSITGHTSEECLFYIYGPPRSGKGTMWETFLALLSSSHHSAMISLVHQQWVEVRTLAIGEPHVMTRADGEPEIHVDHLSYVSRLCDACTFTQHAAGELRRRRVGEARQVCSVTDGAEWCQSLLPIYRPDTLHILDFPHAAEHLTQLLEALAQAGLRFPDRMLERCLHVLKHRGFRVLRRMAEQLGNDLTQQKGVGEHLDYLRKREGLLH